MMNRKCQGWFVMLLGGVIMVSLGAAEAAPGSPAVGIVINEDNSHFYGSRSADDMSMEGLHAFVDQYAGTKVSHLFLCPNAQRASYDSEAWDAIWELGEGQVAPGEGHGKAWFDNARILAEKGLDPYAVWIARCREKGISPWLSMRMNDIHDVNNPSNFMHNTFWVAHPEFWRVPNSPSGSWFDRAFDYSHPEVREHHMALIRELLERYDPDGLELDWMRFGYHFAPGTEAEGVELLAQFMRDVRELTTAWSEKRGHPVKLGARVPTHPDAARGLGMDGVRWAKEGLVDMLVPTPFWASSDFDIPIELWREQMGSAADKIVLAAGLEHNLRAAPGLPACPNNLASVYGFAAAHWHRGADQIYLFNYMDSDVLGEGPQAYRTLVEKGLDRDFAAAQPRRHVVSYRDTVPPSVPNGAVLPAEAQAGVTFRIYSGPTPGEGGRVVFRTGLAGRDGVGDTSLDVSINGEPCKPGVDIENPGQFPNAARALAIECPLSAVKAGYNEIEVKQPEGQPGQQVVWAELGVEPAP